MNFHKKHHLLLILACFLSLFLIADDHRDLMRARIGNVNASEVISPEQRREVLAEYDGGQITRGELDDKINSIEGRFDPKLHSPAGRVQLLEQMGVEAMFYQEALALNIEQDEDYQRRLNNQLIALYARRFKADYMNENITYTEEEKREYYLNNYDKFPGQTQEDAEHMIMRYLRPAKEMELTEQLVEGLRDKYNIQILSDTIEKMNVVDIKDNEHLQNEKIITSSEPELEMTVGVFVPLFTDNPNYRSVPHNSVEDLHKIIEKTVEGSLFGFEAKVHGYEKDKELLNMKERLQKNLLLQTTYNRLVVDKIDLSDEGLRNYYDENIREFSTQPYRKIQEFVFDDESTAKKVLRAVRRAKDNDDVVNALVAKYSKNTNNNGQLPNIYQNQIIPGLGKDEVYSEHVWKTSPSKVSDIFQNRRGEYVFFRIIEDIEAVATPFGETKESIRRTKFRKRQAELFDSVKEQLAGKYNLQTYPDKLIEKLTAEEYFNKAEESQKRRRFRDALYYYDQIIKHYQNQEDDYKALFMKGFILAENLNEKGEALKIFNQVIEEYPEGDLHDSAHFMKEELSGKNQSNQLFEQ